MKTNFTKKLIAMLVGAAFVLSAINASAAENTVFDLKDKIWDYTDNTTVEGVAPIVYASEIKTDGGIELTLPILTGADNDSATDFDLLSEFGFGASAGAKRYLRYQLSNSAEFKNTPTAATDLKICSDDAGDPDTPADLDAGSKTMSQSGNGYIIYQIIAADAGSGITQKAPVKLIGFEGITVHNINPVAVSVAQYWNATDAAKPQNAVSGTSQSMEIIKFGNALKMEKEIITPFNIDVTEESKKFDTETAGGIGSGATKTAIAKLTIALNDPPVHAIDGTEITLATLLGAGSKLILTGNFTATQNSDGSYDPAKVFISSNADNCDTSSQAATTLTADTASFTMDANDDIPGHVICMEVNGTTPITPGKYKALYEPVSLAGYNVPTQNFGVVSELVKNGSTAQKTFVLNDSDAYSCYVRITNPSGISGSVFITMYNDNGDAVTFDLAQVSTAGEAMTGGKMKAGASTPLIPIADLYAAAQAADSSFAVSGSSKKFRFNADAEFGSNKAGDMTGIVVNAIAMARDGNSFFMLP